MHVLILAGKRPRPGTILDETAMRLRLRGFGVDVEWRDPLGASDAARDCLIVHRGLGTAMLKRLSEGGTTRGSRTRVVNPPSACLVALDRDGAMRRLRGAGLPVPRSAVESDWSAVRQRADGGPVFVKATSGDLGRGTGVRAMSDETPARPPFEGPWHVEDAVPRDEWDRKLYVAGNRVFGLMKRWPRQDGSARPFEPPAEMTDLALGVAEEMRLELFGIDLVGRQGTFSIVDLNPFPGYRGVDGAADAVADHIAARATAV